MLWTEAERLLRHQSAELSGPPRLRQRDRDRATTSGCVRATVFDAFSSNFRVTVAEEACFDQVCLPPAGRGDEALPGVAAERGSSSCREGVDERRGKGRIGRAEGA